MVEFTLPQPLSEAFINRIPQQRQAVNRLLHSGKILNYSLSLESSKLWTVFSAHSEAELMEMISSLPLTNYMDVHISELTIFQSANAFAPSFSVN
jgi:muconolactone delta-isomerase